jgi:hypothetical protein
MVHLAASDGPLAAVVEEAVGRLRPRCQVFVVGEGEAGVVEERRCLVRGKLQTSVAGEVAVGEVEERTKARHSVVRGVEEVQ